MSQTPSKSTLWIGRIISAIPVLFMGGLGLYVLLVKPEMAADMHDKYGYPSDSARPVLIAEIACAVLYALPQTSVLGAILLTGAVATHVRAGEPPWFPIIFGVVVWLGLYLRDERIRALVPIRL